eukprot:365276-Chlamydomonas_euryale.AAC.12
MTGRAFHTNVSCTSEFVQHIVHYLVHWVRHMLSQGAGGLGSDPPVVNPLERGLSSRQGLHSHPPARPARLSVRLPVCQ